MGLIEVFGLNSELADGRSGTPKFHEVRTDWCPLLLLPPCEEVRADSRKLWWVTHQ